MPYAFPEAPIPEPILNCPSCLVRSSKPEDKDLDDLIGYLNGTVWDRDLLDSRSFKLADLRFALSGAIVEIVRNIDAGLVGLGKERPRIKPHWATANIDKLVYVLIFNHDAVTFDTAADIAGMVSRPVSSPRGLVQDKN
jgi:hypothetical protein